MEVVTCVNPVIPEVRGHTEPHTCSHLIWWFSVYFSSFTKKMQKRLIALTHRPPDRVKTTVTSLGLSVSGNVTGPSVQRTRIWSINSGCVSGHMLVFSYSFRGLRFCQPISFKGSFCLYECPPPLVSSSQTWTCLTIESLFCFHTSRLRLCLLCQFDWAPVCDGRLTYTLRVSCASQLLDVSAVTLKHNFTNITEVIFHWLSPTLGSNTDFSLFYRTVNCHSVHLTSSFMNQSVQIYLDKLIILQLFKFPRSKLSKRLRVTRVGADTVWGQDDRFNDV